jgi:serine carboxypeptidase-like clade II
LIDDKLSTKGMYDYYWTHALNSDETHAGIEKHCGDFRNVTNLRECVLYEFKADDELVNIDVFNIYAPVCNSSATKNGASYSVSCILFCIICMVCEIRTSSSRVVCLDSV